MPKQPLKHTDFLSAVSNLAKEMQFYGLQDPEQDSKVHLSREELLIIDMMMRNDINVRQYLEMGADPKFKNKKNLSLLQLATAYDHPDLVTLLKELGAQATKKSKTGPKS